MTAITIGITMVRQSVEINQNFATSNFVITSVIYTVFMLQGQRMGNFVHTAFKAYCVVLLGPVWSATCDIGINTINSLVNVVKFAMDDWFN